MKQSFSAPKVLTPAHVVIVRDRREQNPWHLEPLPIVDGTLQTGDYALAAAPDWAVVERKSLPDFLACCGVERPRFTRELERLRGIPHACVIIESDWDVLSRGEWRSQITPSAVLSSVVAWSARYVPILLAGSREGAQDAARRFFWCAARHRWQELRAFVKGVDYA